MEVPADLVLVGHVLDAWRLDGSIKVAPYSSDASALLSANAWWFDVRGVVRAYDVVAAKVHGSTVTARLVGIVDRDAAEVLKGARISVSRRAFPVTDDDAYYWVDLIGLDVVNGSGERLGAVTDLLDNGAHQVLVVGDGVDDAGKAIQRLIPFGPGNPEPLLGLPDARVAYADVVGAAHVKLRLAGGDGTVLDAIAFRAVGTPLGEGLLASRGKAIHAAGRLRQDDWNGRVRVQLEIEDAAPATA